MNAILKFSLIAFVYLLSLVSCAQKKEEFHKTVSQKIEALINSYVENKQFNGAILVAKEGKVIYKKGYGLANMEWNIPNTTDTKFRLASITKQFTAVAILQLVAEGKIDLHKPISTYLPKYPKDKGDVITIHHLLTHSSGIPNYTQFRTFRNINNKDYKPSEFIRFFADSTLQFTPGTEFRYSNSGYFLLGHLIETITGKKYETVLQEKIFSPLKMKNTGYAHQATVIEKRASGYWFDQLERTYKNANHIYTSVPFAAGGLYSTVEDLLLWNQALYSSTLLPEKYSSLITKKHFADRNTHYGYGCEILEMPIGNTSEATTVFGHSGGIDGFRTFSTYNPENKSTIILLNNTDNAPLYQMTAYLNAVLLNKTYDYSRKSVANALAERIEISTLEEVVQSYFVTIKDSNRFYLNENEMNFLGYYYLNAKKLSEAEAIFKLNVEAFPNSFNVYDSYAEALMELGLHNDAFKNYKKSLELNPDNTNAIEMIKKIESK